MSMELGRGNSWVKMGTVIKLILCLRRSVAQRSAGPWKFKASVRISFSFLEIKQIPLLLRNILNSLCYRLIYLSNNVWAKKRKKHICHPYVTWRPQICKFLIKYEAIRSLYRILFIERLVVFSGRPVVLY